MISISSSSFFLSEYLTKQINDNNYSDDQFTFALNKKYIAALTIQEGQADLGSINWISLNRELAKTEWQAALKLGHWYQETAREEDKLALYRTAIMWFEQAMRLHSEQAIVDLAQLYFQQGEIIKAQSILRQLPIVLPSNTIGETALILRIQIAIHLGDTSLVKQTLNSNIKNRHLHNNTLALLADIDKYAIVTNSTKLNNIEHDKNNLLLRTPSSCITSLQLFATNLKHLKHLEKLIKTFQNQQPLAQYVCLPTPRYISMRYLECMAQSHETITCDEASWQSIAEEVNSRHIGLMLNEGGANVHLGILYFDAKDNAEVFSHEVSHLLGFVDEYPLIKAHDNCQGIQSEPFSHNITVLKNVYKGEKKKLRTMILKNVSWANSINENTPILQAIDDKQNKKNKWRLGTPLKYKDQIGIYISETCQKNIPDNSYSMNYLLPHNQETINSASSYSAFKPLSRRTQLRYFAADFPFEYLTLIKENPSAYLMPSFHYNIALALYQQGEVADAKYWLRKAAQWEDDPVRRLRILKGGL